ncbi:MAG: ATP synthase F1 subunit delta [Pseudomonadota bacterium]
MAKLDKATLRYAKAAFDFLADSKKSKDVSHELKAFSKVLSENEELRLALTNEAFSTEDRVWVVKDVAQKLGLSENALRILAILSENRRILLCDSVAERLHQMALEAADVAALEVESAAELKADERKKVEDQFKKILGKEVEASYSLNPNLMGGLRVTAAGRTYDGSLSGWLETMEENLMGGHL